MSAVREVARSPGLRRAAIGVELHAVIPDQALNLVCAIVARSTSHSRAKNRRAPATDKTYEALGLFSTLFSTPARVRGFSRPADCQTRAASSAGAAAAVSPRARAPQYWHIQPSRANTRRR